MSLELLKNLCKVKGASGEENRAAQFILNEIKDYIDDYEIDALGNLIAHKKGDGKKMMLAGHMDQIGMMVTHISKEGFIYFVNVGGLNPYILLGCRVVFDDGTVGVISKEGKAQLATLKISDLFIDIGARTQEEVLKHIQIGDCAVYYEEPISDEFKVTSPYLDDRIGCYFMIEALKRLKDCKYDLYLVFTTQEEVGLRGAITSSYSVNPDFGIAFDVTMDYSTPESDKMPQKAGDGACIKIRDGSLICSPIMVKHMKKCAEEGNIKHQLEVLIAGGTDAGAMQRSRNGVVAGGISIATRYIHSMNETVILSDIEDCIELTVKVLETQI
ncbi:MAG: M42 family metallopeptidase [Lachnospirales bacterium]